MSLGGRFVAFSQLPWTSAYVRLVCRVNGREIEIFWSSVLYAITKQYNTQLRVTSGTRVSRTQHLHSRAKWERSQSTANIVQQNYYFTNSWYFGFCHKQFWIQIDTLGRTKKYKVRCSPVHEAEMCYLSVHTAQEWLRIIRMAADYRSSCGL